MQKKGLFMSVTTPWVPKKIANPINEFLFGKKEKMQKVNLFNKQQKGLQNMLLGQLGGQNTNISQNSLYQSGSNYLQQLLSGSPEATKAFEAPYMRQFNEQIIPQLAERFTGAGAGAQSSSAFQQALGQSGADLTERLASLRGQLQGGAANQALGYAQQPISNFAGLSQQAFRPSFENILRPSTGGVLGGLFGGASQGIGQAGGMAAMTKLLPLLGL